MDSRDSLDGLVDMLKNNFKDYQLPDPDEMKTQFDGRHEEVKNLMTEHKAIKKEMRSVVKDIATFKDSIEKAEASLAKCESRSKQLSEKVAKKETAFTRDSNTIESAVEIWDMLGLSIEQLNHDDEFDSGDKSVEGDFALKFTNVDPQEPNRRFLVKVQVSGNKVKIYETEPKNFLNVSDSMKIENAVNENDLKVDMRYLIILLRKHIKDNFLCKKK